LWIEVIVQKTENPSSLYEGCGRKEVCEELLISRKLESCLRIIFRGLAGFQR
jgi:hypothetical protein